MSRKTEIQDVTFLIPVRLDSIVRLENLLMVVDFLHTHFNTHIHILEAGSYNNRIMGHLLPKEVKFNFIEDFDPVFFRTRYINKLVEDCQTPLLAVWDSDVIVPPQQLTDSVTLLRQNKAHFVYPYEEKFLDTSEIIRELYLKKRDIKILTSNSGKMKSLYLPNPLGGGFLADRKSYMETGGENEFFYGWGREDGDRRNRWCTLGYTIKRISGPLFHFTHERGINSSFHASDQDELKMSEIYRIYAMSKKELKEEINSW